MLRARFFRLEVRRFGTAMVSERKRVGRRGQELSPRRLRSASQRGSTAAVSHRQASVLRSAPQLGHRPLQSARHSTKAGTLSGVSLGYGVGNYFLYNGDRDKAMTIFRKIVAGNQWSSFGYIAAEAELKNER